MAMMPASRKRYQGRRLSAQRGMTLIELMITVSVAGILASLAATSFTQQVRMARSTEAVEMLGSIKGAVQVAGTADLISGTGLDFSATTFGKPAKEDEEEGTPTDVDEDGNNGHGDSDGCDPSNPSGKCKGKPATDDSPSGGDNADDDGDNGHGNDDGNCDPSNPGKSKNCDPSSGDGDGDDDGASTGDGDGDSSSGGDGDGAGGPTSPPVGAGSSVKLCDSATPVPGSIDLVSGRAYQSSPQSWSTGSDSSGWRCLRVGRSGAQSYQYGYDVGAGTLGDSTESYTAWARGDLDADGRTSLFRIRGEVVGGQVIHAPAIEMIDQSE